MTGSERKVRLDRLLTSRGLARSRSNAQDMVRRGVVLVDNAVARKPAEAVSHDAALALVEPERYVSRAAYKLRAALEAFGFSARGRRCLDIGASTGGFTQVLLEDGAANVAAVDVGHGQLHESLARDPRVMSLEGVDIRRLAATHDVGPFDGVAADVSFISLLKVLPAALPLAANGAWIVALIKPQFEVGRAHVGKGGVVRDEAAVNAAVARIRDFLAEQPCWRVVGVIPSPIRGQSGNREYLLGAVHDG